MTRPWLTIVTVVKDDPTGLASTLDSVRLQDCSDVKIVVIDSSADYESVQRLCPEVASVTWVPPKGIFAAMNVGLSQASGAYVYFLNAGDRFHDAEVLTRVRARAGAGGDLEPVWMFGPVWIIDSHGGIVITPPWDYASERAHFFSRGFFPQHQGTFIRTDALRAIGGFSLDYSVAADYAAFLAIAQDADPWELDFVIADFFAGGASSTKWQQSFREFHRARRDVFNLHGGDALRERIETGIHFARVWAYHEVVAPLKRLARR